MLGKIVGVYLGRPFEGWTHERIEAELGEVDRYVHERLGVPLVVTDDDISGTFTFLRALPDNGNRLDLSAAQVGQTWLNYIIERKTILWWGGFGRSTEHTAFIRLQSGIPAPESGSIRLNGPVVAEQIGAQIFIDGWGLVNPGDPERAAHFARLAGSVSHDGAAIHCAQVVAAMVAGAFVEGDVERVISIGASVIPADSLVRRLIDDVREWHVKGLDWRAGFAKIKEHYGYDKFGGGCHTIPNHALIIHGLLHGDGDFTRSLMVVNTCGWDTDCNSGNVGCIVGVMSGLAAIGPEWRTPVADRLFLPTADGGRAVTDATHEAVEIANIGRALRGMAELSPKDGARFHFSLPGSVQGFRGDCRPGIGRLVLDLSAGRARAVTPTFTTPDELKMPGYSVVACPTLYPGQRVRARVEAGSTPATARIYLGVYRPSEGIEDLYGDVCLLRPGEDCILEWQVPDVGGFPIADVGIEAEGSGELSLDWLTWDQEPCVDLLLTDGGPAMRAAWVDAMDSWEIWADTSVLVQNRGTGLLIQGSRQWRNYRMESVLSSNLAKSFGVAARVQGLKRYYALRVTADAKAQLIRELDVTTVLAESPFQWRFGEPLTFRFHADGDQLSGSVNGLELNATDDCLRGGAAAIILTEGSLNGSQISVRPIA